MNAKVRLHCNCGWEQWIEFDGKLTDKEVEEQYKTIDIIRMHMIKAHRQFDTLESKYLGRTRITLKNKNLSY